MTHPCSTVIWVTEHPGSARYWGHEIAEDSQIGNPLKTGEKSPLRPRLESSSCLVECSVNAVSRDHQPPLPEVGQQLSRQSGDEGVGYEGLKMPSPPVRDRSPVTVTDEPPVPENTATAGWLLASLTSAMCDFGAFAAR